MSRREFVSRFYHNEDDYTKQIENSLKTGDLLLGSQRDQGDSYLNLSDEINFKAKPPKENDAFNDHSNQGNYYKAIESKPPVDIDSPGYTQTSFKDQTPKNTGCGFIYTLRRLKHKLCCKSKPALEETFAYDPFKKDV